MYYANCSLVDNNILPYLDRYLTGSDLLNIENRLGKGIIEIITIKSKAMRKFKKQCAIRRRLDKRKIEKNSQM